MAEDRRENAIDTCDRPSRHYANPNPSQAVQCVTSEQLLGDRSRLIILHEGEAYQLARTSKGKLILTK